LDEGVVGQRGKVCSAVIFRVLGFGLFGHGFLWAAWFFGGFCFGLAFLLGVTFDAEPIHVCYFDDLATDIWVMAFLMPWSVTSVAENDEVVGRAVSSVAGCAHYIHLTVRTPPFGCFYLFECVLFGDYYRFWIAD
jgi:hypothetical protein